MNFKLDVGSRAGDYSPCEFKSSKGGGCLRSPFKLTYEIFFSVSNFLSNFVGLLWPCSLPDLAACILRHLISVLCLLVAEQCVTFSSVCPQLFPFNQVKT